MTAAEARARADEIARQSYGRLVAFLAARSRDIAGAEDALADAFRLALERWPRDGIPRVPEAWLLTVARRQLGKAARHSRVVASAEPDILVALNEAMNAMEADPQHMMDDRLKLLFVCAHPAVASDAQTPLMLQTVLGIDAARIAAAFLVPPPTMSQRLVRAKARIRETGIRFEVPDMDELPDRLDAVLQAIYAAYGTGWDALGGEGGALAEEAIWLGRTTLALMPDEPEVKGLLALMLHCQARRAARREDGRFIPLDEQDTGLWDAAMAGEADNHLAAAGRQARFGRFQCEAAIQSVHAARRRTGTVDRQALETLYAALVKLSPAIGAQVAAAAAAVSAERGLRELDSIPESAVASYQPYFAVRADLLRRLGRMDEARTAYGRAVALAADPATRQFLLARMAQA
ncbi:MAG: DUF6596 domain-containing protein [Hyphomicrobiales bacterium]